MSEANTANFFTYGKKYMSSGLVLPFWHFVTLELLLYFFGHVLCLYLLLFTATDLPFSKLGGTFLRDYFWYFLKGKNGDPFEVFRSCVWLSSSQSHKMSSDLVLTFLLLFTSNAIFLTLMNRIDVVVTGKKNKTTNAGANSVEDARNSPINGRGDWSSLFLVRCDELLRNCMICKALLLCIIVPVCVFSQPPNEVRSLGPVGVLLSIVVGVCVVELHGGLEVLKKFLNGMQVIIILLLIFFSAEANLFS